MEVLMGKSSINEPFSIAMLVYQRVYMYMYLLVAAGMCHYPLCLA